MMSTATETALNAEIFPVWWYFDGSHGLLYCEVERGNKYEFRQEIARVIPSDKYENAWVGCTKFSNYILWKDKEITADNPIIAKVENWRLQGEINGEYEHSWTFCLYLAIRNHLYWSRNLEDGVSVSLKGNYKGGNKFIDCAIRLVVPLQNGHTLAINNQNRWYFLYNHPIDQADFEREEYYWQKNRQKERNKAKRAERKAERQAKRAERKAERQAERARRKAAGR